MCVTLVIAFATDAHGDPDKNPDDPERVSVIDRRVPPEPARPAPPVAAPPDMEGAPLPGNESGRTDAGDGGDSGSRQFLRGMLFLPKVAVNVVLFPIRTGVWAEERYHLSDRYRRTFFSADQKFGFYPTGWFETGFGVTLGAQFFAGDVFGAGEQLTISALAGGNFYHHGAVRLRSGQRFGDRLELEASARYDRRPEEYFYGIGNADEVPRPDMLIDPLGSDGAVESRFRQRRTRATVTADLLAWKSLHFRVAGSLFDATYAPSDPGRPIDHVYEVDQLAGFDGVSQLYTELELRWDSRGSVDRMEPRSLHSTGSLASVFGGFAAPLDDGYEYWCYGVDLQQYFRIAEAPRVVAVRFHGEGVSEPTTEVPFAELPRLGGSRFLRGYAVDRFRDRIAAFATVEYRWDLARFLAASVFVDAGRVYSSLSDLGLSDLRVGYGVGLEAHSYRSFIATLNLASSIDGGVFVNLSFNPVFDLDERVRRR